MTKRIKVTFNEIASAHFIFKYSHNILIKMNQGEVHGYKWLFTLLQ